MRCTTFFLSLILILISNKTAKIQNRSYTVMSGVEGVALDATLYRNLGAMVNHSVYPNAELQCFFDKGAEQAIITATKYIAKVEPLSVLYALFKKGRSAACTQYIPPLTSDRGTHCPWSPQSSDNTKLFIFFDGKACGRHLHSSLSAISLTQQQQQQLIHISLLLSFLSFPSFLSGPASSDRLFR